MPSAAALGAESVLHFDSLGSTMDEVHARARAGAPAGLLVVADRQNAGRGRSGNSWTSETGAGLWCTLLERPTDPAAVRVLSLRVGLAIARAAQTFSDSTIRVKWPNDLYTAHGKLGGILIEARWRESAIDWVAIGVGINLQVPHDQQLAAALAPGTARSALLLAIVPAIREAARGACLLSAEELAEWHGRDLAIGRQVSAPVAGVVVGVAADGALLVLETNAAQPTPVHAGSMQFTTSSPEREC